MEESSSNAVPFRYLARHPLKLYSGFAAAAVMNLPPGLTLTRLTRPNCSAVVYVLPCGGGDQSTRHKCPGCL